MEASLSCYHWLRNWLCFTMCPCRSRALWKHDKGEPRAARKVLAMSNVQILMDVLCVWNMTKILELWGWALVYSRCMWPDEYCCLKFPFFLCTCTYTHRYTTRRRLVHLSCLMWPDYQRLRQCRCGRQTLITKYCCPMASPYLPFCLLTR